ncbi:MAG: long-chain fatty acid--CoA ligase [Methanobacteriota archaeon]|nr:MAG: long-chain fatty acid--CoA ligase [Euryarchaeota archaeon]
MNISFALENSAAIFPSKVAIISGESEYTYNDINGLASRLASGLQQLGIKKGERVAVSCPNTWQFPVIYFGIHKIGAIVVPLNILLKAGEIAYFLKDSGATAFICHSGESGKILQEGRKAFLQTETCKHMIVVEEKPIGEEIGFEELLRSEEEYKDISTEREETAVILYTSGTTGRSKGAELTHGNLFENALAVAGLMQLTSKDVHLVTLPLFHSFGQTVQLNAGFFAGSTLVLQRRFDPEKALQKMRKYQATIFVGVPTMYWGLLHTEIASEAAREIKETLRLGVSGGSAMPIEVLKEFERKFETIILESYGLSETSPVACFSRIDMPRKVGSIGVPLPGTEMKIVDEEGNDRPIGEIGEILIRGHNIMKGYFNRPRETERAFKGGWFHTGDLGKMDEDGYFYIVDRKKDLIIRGGYNVYPREVEEIMMTHPYISLVAVVGEKDKKYGEEIVAYVVPRKDTKPDEGEIIQWCRERMAAYKYPRKIRFVKDLPKTATGKIMKRALKKN